MQNNSTLFHVNAVDAVFSTLQALPGSIDGDALHCTDVAQACTDVAQACTAFASALSFL